MKHSLLAFIFIVLLGSLCRLGLPWWALAPIAAVAGWLFTRNALAAFGVGFLAGATLWYATALLADLANGSQLSGKVGELFLGLKTGHLLWATGVMGGLLGGFGALTGCWARDLLLPAPKRRNYLQEKRRK